MLLPETEIRDARNKNKAMINIKRKTDVTFLYFFSFVISFASTLSFSLAIHASSSSGAIIFIIIIRLHTFLPLSLFSASIIFISLCRHHLSSDTTREIYYLYSRLDPAVFFKSEAGVNNKET